MGKIGKEFVKLNNRLINLKKLKNKKITVLRVFNIKEPKKS